jgi:hypothetical protein
MNPSDLKELRTQHEELRTLIDRCEALADALDAGRIEPFLVLAGVAELRIKLAEHNRFEERVLPEIDHDDHAEEHRVTYEGLEITRELREMLHRLRRHMASEERLFQSWPAACLYEET